jgi:hypothetical protein
MPNRRRHGRLAATTPDRARTRVCPDDDLVENGRSGRGVQIPPGLWQDISNHNRAALERATAGPQSGRYGPFCRKISRRSEHHWV